jgi:hypothetical protein
MTVSVRLEETSLLPPPASPGARGRRAKMIARGGHQDGSQASPSHGHDSLVKLIAILFCLRREIDE